MKVSMPDAAELNIYYQSYLKYLQTDDLLESLKMQQKSTTDFWASIPAGKETYRYAEGKWSVREVCGHLCDTERIMSYRALRLARRDPTALAGYDENLYTANSNYNDLTLADIASQKQAIRESSCRLFGSFTSDMFNFSGFANNTKVSVRAILFFIIAHEMHHNGVVKERYLK